MSLAAIIEYSSQAPYPLVQRRLPDHLLTANADPDYIPLILKAKESFKDVIPETPLVKAVNLSERLGNNIWLKREDTQVVFSFKIRGAYNCMINLDKEEREKGVATCSAGNHAQGVAFSSSKLGINAVIVMPIGTPSIKVKAVERLGGKFVKIIIGGKDFDEAKKICDDIVEKEGRVYVPPFDDSFVIAGQGTIGLEILNQIAAPDAVFVQIGGGGLASGISEYIKGKASPPNTKVIGVEAVDQDAMKQSIAKGELVTLKEVGPFADGTAVKTPGVETFRICRKRLDGIVLATNDQICAAIKDIFEDTRSIAEPSGALALAGLKRYIEDQGCKDKTFVAVISGANMNFVRLRFVAENAELGEGREALFSVSMPERSGGFADLYNIIAHAGIPPESSEARVVTEYLYRRDSSGNRSRIMLSFNVLEGSSPHEDVQKVLAALNNPKSGNEIRAEDISGNRLAKNHVRYMIGGTEIIPYERIFRFAFPERPSSFPNFIEKMHGRWDISMFNYRNHGDDVGKVLVGFEVLPPGEPEFEVFLKDLGFSYEEETANGVYREFLWEGGK